MFRRRDLQSAQHVLRSVRRHVRVRRAGDLVFSRRRGPSTPRDAVQLLSGSSEYVGAPLRLRSSDIQNRRCSGESIASLTHGAIRSIPAVSVSKCLARPWWRLRREQLHPRALSSHRAPAMETRGDQRTRADPIQPAPPPSPAPPPAFARFPCRTQRPSASPAAPAQAPPTPAHTTNSPDTARRSTPPSRRPSYDAAATPDFSAARSASVARMRTTIAVMLSSPPRPFASEINASTTRCAVARDESR